MSNWYQSAQKEDDLLQGDIIFNFPVLKWKSDMNVQKVRTRSGLNRKYKANIEVALEDVIVITQSCDLANCKTKFLTCCSVFSWEEFKLKLIETGQNEKNCKKIFNSIRDGFRWNYFLLSSEEVADYGHMDCSMVDFSVVFTVPIQIVKTTIDLSNSKRLRLKSPYIEHLSQSFARYYMRVGLPTQIQYPEPEKKKPDQRI